MPASHWRLGLHVIRKSLRHPAIALRRLLQQLHRRRRGEHREHQRLLAFLPETFAVESQALSQEYRDSTWAAYARLRREALACWPGAYRLGTSSAFTCEALYLLVRAAQPQVVVETGVLYGASSAAILAALERNGQGELYSIDLGNPPHEPPHDFFIPRRLQERWQLILGDSKDELPPLLDRLGTVDLFHHDSLHTDTHMRWEYATAWRHLSPQGVLSSDDVLAPLRLRTALHRHPFREFCVTVPAPWGIFYGCGIARRQGMPS